MKCVQYVTPVLVWLCVLANGNASESSFTNLLAQAEQAARAGDVSAASELYASAEHKEATNAVHLCLLAHKYCDLTFLTNSVMVQKELLQHALACSREAVSVDSSNATAHVSLAVCYGKLSEFADIKSKLKYSKLLKLEAEHSLALDARQDIAYYLLGRWNYGIANVGFFSRTFVRLVYGEMPSASNEQAIVDFKKAIAIAPNRIIHHAGLAMVYGTMGQKQSQIEELKICCRLKPIGREDQEARRNAIKQLAALDPAALK